MVPLNAPGGKLEGFGSAFVQFREGFPNLLREHLDGSGIEGYPVKPHPVFEKGPVPPAPDIVEDFPYGVLQRPVADPASPLHPVENRLEAPV